MDDLRHMELLEDLSPFGTAKAVLVRWDGENYVRTNQVIDVCEFMGHHGERRDRGYVRWFEESRRWEAMGIQDLAGSWLP